MNARRWSSCMARAAGAALMFSVVAVTAAPAGYTSTAEDSSAPSARDLLRAASDAVRATGNIHHMREVTYDGDLLSAETERVHRQEEWQQGRLYRREDERCTFLLGDEWALERDSKSGIVMAALRRDTDDAMYLPSEHLTRSLDLEQVASAYSQVAVSEQIQRRTVDGRERRGVTLVESPQPDGPRAMESYYQVTMLFWLDAATGLPMEWESVNRDESGHVRAASRSEYEYDIDLPEDWFSPRSVLGEDVVVLGWEHLRELVGKPAIASTQIQVGGRDVTVEVHGVEALPRGQVLIVGSIGHSPDWLGAHLIRQNGSEYRSFSLAWERRIMHTPWYGGGSGPPRLDFAMVFGPEGGGTRSFSVPAPGLTWRAWGLFHYFANSGADTAEPRFVEEDVAFSLALPLPEEPLVVHELVRDQGRE